MNIAGAGAPGTTGASRTAPTERKSERREPTADLAEPQAQFELALRAKQSRREEKDDREDERQDEPSDAAKSGLAAGLVSHQPTLCRAAEEPAPSAPRAADAPSTGPRAAIEAALNAHVAPGITEVGADTLARHATRLDERLRKRGVDAAHVRIEEDAHERDPE